MKKLVLIGLLLIYAGSLRAQSAPANPYFTGTGGKGMSLAILVPQGQGLPTDQSYLPTMTQGVFVGDFSKYSAVSVLDRQNLDKVIAENYSGYYEEDHPDLNKLGHLLPTDYIMTGTITKTGSGYALQMQIADNKTNVTKASYSGTCTIPEFDSFTGIRKASADLLTQFGVALTDKAKQELGGASAAQYVEAQKSLAQGITAQQKGTVVEALSYYFQAAGYDPGLAEAASRLNIMSANISSGNIGQNARNDIQWRKDWIARLTECEQFFFNYIKDNAPYRLMYSTDLEQGNIDYVEETLSLTTRMALNRQGEQWFETLEKVVETVRQGLEKTGRASTWGLDWPRKPVAGREMLNRWSWSPNLNILMELKNENGKVIGKQTVTPGGYGFTCLFADNTGFSFLRGEYLRFIVIPHDESLITVTFNGVKAEDITDRLSISVTSIDGVNAERAAQAKHISIVSSDEYYKSKVAPLVNGQKGPAGGIVFTDGLRWFEAAPAETEFKTSWNSAIAKCRLMSYGGVMDWHLPDSTALFGMYLNLKEKGLGGFSNDSYWYWSSQVDDFNVAGCYDFEDGDHQFGDSDNRYLVRAVRDF